MFKTAALWNNLLAYIQTIEIKPAHVLFGAVLALYGSGWSPLLGLIVGSIIGVLYTPTEDEAEQGISLTKDLDTVLGAIAGALLGALIKALIGWF
jgi:hypothetical protein